MHELATNSLKYGALSAESGTLDWECTAPGRDVVTRLDRTSAAAADRRASLRPALRCSELIRRAYALQLGGSIAFDWSAEGLIVTLRMREPLGGLNGVGVPSYP
jgi:two-component sensor histidine kinase